MDFLSTRAWPVARGASRRRGADPSPVGNRASPSPLGNIEKQQLIQQNVFAKMCLSSLPISSRLAVLCWIRIGFAIQNALIILRLLHVFDFENVCNTIGINNI